MDTTVKLSYKRSFSNILFILKYVLRYTPGYLANVCLLGICSVIELFFEFTYCRKYLLDLIQYNGEFKDAVLYLLVVMVAIVIKLRWIAHTEQRLYPIYKEKLHKEMQAELFNKAVHLDLDRYDNPDCYNEFVWSISEANSRIDAIMSDLDIFCRSVTGIFVTGIFFLALNKTGLLFVLASLIITVLTNLKIGKLTFQMDNELKPIQRKRNYYNRIFYLNDYAKELRLNPVGDKLKEDFSETNQKVYPIVKAYGRKKTVLSSIGDVGANSLLLEFAYVAYLVYQTVSLGLLSYGSMLSLFGAASSLKNSLRKFAEIVPKFQQHSFYVEKIRSFLELEAQIKDGPESIFSEEFHSLSMENVTFCYGDNEPTLKDISMSVRAGEKIAIVGYNGAGKTTLLKLFMRLYDVKNGCIQVNGRNIKEYAVKDYRNLYGSVFQDYKLFAASLGENVKTDCVTDTDTQPILQALDNSGFTKRYMKLKNGLNTMITREFDEEGVNLSGGEAQKVAIARSFLKDCPIIILDEPSSALDPISEYNLNEAMLRAAQHKTVLFISHRLSSTKMADRIYMLESGRIIEHGSHQELMASDGKYAQMFRLQSEKYALTI